MLITLEKVNKTDNQKLTGADILKIDNNATTIENALNNVGQQSKTYAELQVMVLNNELIAGTQYLLSDYKTKYQQPNTLIIKEMAVERLVLTAISTNKFAIECSSLDYPQDIIYYDFNNNKCEDNTTSRNGFIIRRIDIDKKINCTGDWRTLLWARYLPNQTQYLIGSTLTDYSVWTSGNAQLGVIYKYGNSLFMAKNTNVPTSPYDIDVFYSICNNITIGILRNDLKVGKYAGNDIKIAKSSSYLEYLSFSNSCTNISFLENIILANNVLRGRCDNNTFKTNCYGNTLEDLCKYNTFECNCINNYLGNSCSYNKFENGFSENTLSSNCSYNTFGIGFLNNYLGNGCSYNKFENYCSNNLLGNNKRYFSTKYLQSKDVSEITDLENRSYTTTIECRNDGNCVYWSLDATNTPIYTVIA